MAIEIVVQDNFSRPETKQVVDDARLRDSRVCYSRSEYPTSQRHNFELGVAATTGDYITIIGDDDGYTLGSLDWLAKHLRKNPVDAVRWRLVHYAWPSLSTDGEGFVRIYASHYYGGWANRGASEIADATLSATNAGSWENILIYHGMISRKLYDRMRAFTDGVFFSYPMPDVYAHNVMAFHCDKILSVDNPVSIYGTSGHSAGSSWARVTEENGDQASAGQQWIAESRSDPIAVGLGWQPDIRTLRYHDYSALKIAESKGMLKGQSVDRDVWTKAIISEISTNPWSLGPWLKAEERSADDRFIFAAVREHFANIADSIPQPPGNKYEPTYPDTLLRVRYGSKPFSDDVEGAMLALAELMNDGAPIFEVARADPQPTLKRKTFAAVRSTARYLADSTPPQMRTIMQHPSMPAPIVRTLRRLRWYESERARFMASRLVALRRAHGAQKTTQ